MIKLNRNQVVLRKMNKVEDDCYVAGSASQRVSFMWELTQEIWSLQGEKNAQRRLQRQSLLKNKVKLDVKYLRKQKGKK